MYDDRELKVMILPSFSKRETALQPQTAGLSQSWTLASL